VANFDKAFAFMAPHEWNLRRNYTNDPDDPGGPTKFGITLNAWRELGSHADLNNDGVIDAKDIQLLTEAEAKVFYQTRYWKVNDISDDRLASKLFDIGVNLGTQTATCYLQKAINSLGGAVSVDGKLGQTTAAEANKRPAADLLKAICDLQQHHYETWIAERTNREKYRSDLIGRAKSLPIA
jgi:lysozyme family protein